MAAIQVTETSVEGQNVQRAIDFVRDMGHTSMADNILAFLRDGRLYHKTMNENGDTHPRSRDITISDAVIQYHFTNAADRATPMDADKHFGNIVELSRTLVHEKVHAHQGLGTWIWGNLPGRSGHEIEAWGKTIRWLDEWLETHKERHDALPPGDAAGRARLLKKMQVLTAVKVDTIGACIGEGHYTDLKALEKEQVGLQAWIAQETAGVSTPLPPLPPLPGEASFPMRAAAVAVGIAAVAAVTGGLAAAHAGPFGSKATGAPGATAPAVVRAYGLGLTGASAELSFSAMVLGTCPPPDAKYMGTMFTGGWKIAESGAASTADQSVNMLALPTSPFGVAMNGKIGSKGALDVRGDSSIEFMHLILEVPTIPPGPLKAPIQVTGTADVRLHFTGTPAIGTVTGDCGATYQTGGTISPP
jgi:hypothetical protein